MACFPHYPLFEAPLGEPIRISVLNLVLDTPEKKLKGWSNRTVKITQS